MPGTNVRIQTEPRGARAAVRVAAWVMLFTLAAVFAICVREWTWRDGKNHTAAFGWGVVDLLVGALTLWVRFDALPEGRFYIWRILSGRLRAFVPALSVLAVLFVMAIWIEAAFYAANALRPARGNDLKINRASSFVPSGDYGYVCTQGLFNNSTLGLGARAGYDVVYTVGADGFRVTPQDNVSLRQSHVLFFGCSYTFGMGCDDEETLPAHFAHISPAAHTYNFGTMGYGPAQCLALLLHDRVLRTVQEADGVAVYSFFEDHFRRAIGSMRRRNTWAMAFPVFGLSTPGDPRFLGSFEDLQPWRTRAYQWLGHEQFMQWADLDWPLNYAETDIRYVADLFAASRRAYCETIGGREFYVMLHPTGRNTQEVERLAELLSERGVPVIDYRNLFRDKPMDAYIFADGHPTPLANRYIAEHLAQDLCDAGIGDRQSSQ